MLDCLTARPEGAGRASDDAPLVVGDFNATPWSNAFAGPSSRGWRRATGLAPTWPVAWRGVMGIPIDHVLASSAWRVGGARVGPDIGSDHRPVMARLYAEPPAADAGPRPTEEEPLAAITSCLSRAPASVRSGA